MNPGYEVYLCSQMMDEQGVRLERKIVSALVSYRAARKVTKGGVLRKRKASFLARL